MESLSNALAGALFTRAPTPAASRAKPRDSVQAVGRRKGARRQEIEADHQRALARAFAYRAQQAVTHGELEALEREFEARMAEGPDFTHYRAKSKFGPPPPHGLKDRNERARLRLAFNSMARGTWQARQPGKHRGAISRTCRDVFAALLYLADRYDQLFPSLLRIASLAQCSKDRVVAAIATLERLGFLSKHRRLKLVEGPLGRKAEQDTNAYQLHFPRAGTGALLLSLFSPRSESNYQAATATEILSYLERHPETWGSPGPAYGWQSGEPPMAAPVC